MQYKGIYFFQMRYGGYYTFWFNLVFTPESQMLPWNLKKVSHKLFCLKMQSTKEATGGGGFV